MSCYPKDRKSYKILTEREGLFARDDTELENRFPDFPYETCYHCNGTGSLNVFTNERFDAEGHVHYDEELGTCPNCKGTGKIKVDLVGDHALFDCGIDYITDYAIFTEKSQDGTLDHYMVDHLFEKTKELAKVARKNHRRTHLNDIEKAEMLLPFIVDRIEVPEYRRRTRGGKPTPQEDYEETPKTITLKCNLKKDIEIESQIAKCSANRFLASKFAEAHPEANTDTHYTMNCRDPGESGSKEIENCKKLGCDEQVLEELSNEKAGRWACREVNNDKIMSRLSPDIALHYDIDQKLKAIIKTPDTAKTIDKITAIETFASSNHHGGSVLDFACHTKPVSVFSSKNNMDAIVLDVLDCLHGVDWEL
jgi:hypothetical protein